jgi:hypothetical protein
MSHDEKKKDIKEFYDYLSHAASLQDCTGLIPGLAASEAEREAYEAIHRYLPKILNEDEDDI